MDSLPLEDVRSIVRLLADAADPALPRDVPAVRRRLIAGLADVVGADAWVWQQAKLDPVAQTHAYFSYIDGGWESDEQRRIALATEYAEEPREVERQFFSKAVTHMTRTRSEVVPDEQWYGSPLYARFRLPANLDDFLFSFYPVGQNVVSGLGLHRKTGKPRFSDRERCIVHLVTGEVDWLHRAGSDVPAAEHVGTLTPRLRQVLLLLLSGLSRKQVAGQMGLSEHTVADYMKALHKHFNVNSRGELMSKFITGTASPG